MRRRVPADVELCHECGVPLVHPEEIAWRDARELRPSEGLVVLRTAPIAWVRALAADLERQGIRYRIDRRRAREDGLVTLYVRRQNREAAAAVDADRERIEAPFDRDATPAEIAAVEAPAERELRREAPTFKVCPRCGGEYRLDVERCADCGTPLVFPDEAGAAADEAEAEGAEEWPEAELDEDVDLPFDGPLRELPPSDDLVCVSCNALRPLQALSQSLDEAGISHRLDPAPYGKPGVGCLYVLPRDGDATAAVDAAMNGSPLDGAELPVDLTTCPACGAAHSLNAAECPSCGLGLSGPVAGAPCPVCGAVVWVATGSCPNCAAVLPQS